LGQLILLRGASQLLTLRGPLEARRGAALGELGIIADGSMLIRDGQIITVGPTRRIENLKESKTALEVPVYGKVVMPGFVDASLQLSLRRAHSLQTLKRAADFSEDCLNLLRSCLHHGTIAADVQAYAGARTYHSDIAVLRKLVKIGNNPIRMTRTWKIARSGEIPHDPENPEDQRITFDTLLRRKFIDGVLLEPTRPGDYDPELLAAAQVEGLPIKMSWAGGPGSTFEALLQEIDPHAVAFLGIPTAEEIAAVAQRRAIAVLPAGKTVFEGPKRSCGRDLADAGAALALSSGYDSAVVASSSMQMTVALAVARLGLSPAEAIVASTVNAAYAAGWGGVTGTLEPGKQADILVLNNSDYRELPLQFGINHASMVFRAGSVVFNRTRWKLPVEQPTHRMRTQLR
jgi:imidazolonepropionase